MIIRFLVISLIKALPRLVSLAGQPALGIMVVPNFFHLRIMEAIVLLVSFNAADFFKPSSDLCLYAILSLSSAGSSFDLMALLLL